jgi:hypothetical protein
MNLCDDVLSGEPARLVEAVCGLLRYPIRPFVQLKCCNDVSDPGSIPGRSTKKPFGA